LELKKEFLGIVVKDANKSGFNKVVKLRLLEEKRLEEP